MQCFRICRKETISERACCACNVRQHSGSQWDKLQICSFGILSMTSKFHRNGSRQRTTRLLMLFPISRFIRLLTFSTVLSNRKPAIPFTSNEWKTDVGITGKAVKRRACEILRRAHLRSNGLHNRQTKEQKKVWGNVRIEGVVQQQSRLSSPIETKE